MVENTTDFWRRIVPPLVSAFAVFLLMLRYAFRHPEEESAERGSWREFLRYLVVTATSGFAVLLGIVLVFHVILARDPGAFWSAAGGGLLLLAIVLPAFILGEWLGRRRAERS